MENGGAAHARGIATPPLAGRLLALVVAVVVVAEIQSDSFRRFGGRFRFDQNTNQLGALLLRSLPDDRLDGFERRFRVGFVDREFRDLLHLALGARVRGVDSYFVHGFPLHEMIGNTRVES